MKSEFFVVGIILIMVGIGVSFYGYKQMQPTGLEKTIDTIAKWGEALSGEKSPLPKRDKTGSVLIMILGGIFFIVGLNMIIKSGGNRESRENIISSQMQDYPRYCPNCGVHVSDGNQFCSKCGAKIES